MSIRKCLLLLLVCLSLHTCNARRLEKRFQPSSQNIQKDTSVKAKEESSSLRNDHVTAEVQSKADTWFDSNTAENLQNSKGKEGRVTNIEKAKASAAAPKQSLASVSWRVPQNSRREKHPGFNLDYSPPKTHPPCHN